MQEVVGDDGVKHAHAAFIEDAEDGFLRAEAAAEVAAEALVLGGEFQMGEIADVGLIVGNAVGFEPLAEAVLEEGIGEGLAPERGVGDAGLGERGVEIQKADKAGPLAAPIRHGEDGAAVGGQSGQNMMRILPHGLGDDERCIRRDAAEDLDAFPLAGDEAVLLFRIVRMRPFDDAALGFESSGQSLLHGFLRGPAGLIGRKTQITAGDEVDGLAHGAAMVPQRAGASQDGSCAVICCEDDDS